MSHMQAYQTKGDNWPAENDFPILQFGLHQVRVKETNDVDICEKLVVLQKINKYFILDSLNCSKYF